MRMRLKYKLIVSYLVVSIVTIVTLLMTSSYLITNQFNEYVKRNMENNMMLLATQVNLELNRTQQDVAMVNWESFGSAAFDQGFILTIESAKNEILWCTQCVYDEDCASMLTSLEHTMRSMNPDFAGEYMEKQFDLIQHNQIIGTMILGHYGPYHYSKSEIAFLEMMQKLFLLGAFGFIVLAVFLGYAMANRISKPIDDVIIGTKRIAKGKYDELVTQKSTTIELNELIDSVNHLGASLSKQQQIKKNMATDYAHEFRTPLAVLRSSLEGMMDGVWEVTPQRLQSLHEEIMRLTRMIEGIDRLVEVENTGFVLNPTAVELRSLITTIANNFAGELHEKQLTLQIHGKEIEVIADADKMGQVIVNLLSNAIKYNRPNTKIDITIAKNKNDAVIKIKDQGLGIAQEDLPFIFEHLYRADKSRRYDTGGSGIGLSIVRSLVEAHEGRIEVESKLDVGTCFTVHIPIQGIDQSEAKKSLKHI